jgi:tRNA 2-thiouridine synthesizing protein A
LCFLAGEKMPCVPVHTHVLTGHYGMVGRDLSRGAKMSQGTPPAAGPGAVAGADVRLVIDALGRKCPIPIIMLARQICDVPIGSVVAVLADDPAAFTDVPAWAAMKSHSLAFREEYQAGWAFGIRRNY